MEEYNDAMEEMAEDMAEDQYIYQSQGAANGDIVHEAPYGYRQEVDFQGNPVVDPWGNPVYTEIDYNDQYEWDAWTNTYTNEQLYNYAYSDPSPTAHTPGFVSNDPYSLNDPNEPYSNAYYQYVQQNGGVDPYAGQSMTDYAFSDPSTTPHTPGFYSNDPLSANDPSEPYTNAWYQIEQQNAWDQAVNQNTDPMAADQSTAPPGMM